METKKNLGAINYFHRRIDNFDEVYNGKSKGLKSFWNNTIRASVKARLNLAFEILGDFNGRSVLDIGCGSGRYMIPAAEKGASNVVGLDAAAGAIEKAKKLMAEFKVDDKAEFIEMEFLEWSDDRKFDIVFAVGYFDYIFNPIDHLKKMTELSNGVIYASFPKVWSIFTITRKIRLALNKCPVRHYTKSGIKKILDGAGCENYTIRSVYRDYVVIIRK